MFCQKCGTQIMDGQRFCPNCGSEQSCQSQLHAYTDNSSIEHQTNEAVNDAFVKGIVSAVLAEIPVASIVAIFLGNNAKKTIDNARAASQQYGFKLSRKNIAARICGIVGFWLGIAMTAFWTFYILIFSVLVPLFIHYCR